MEQAKATLNAAQMDFLQLLGHIKTIEELEELSQVVFSPTCFDCLTTEKDKYTLGFLPSTYFFFLR